MTPLRVVRAVEFVDTRIDAGTVVPSEDPDALRGADAQAWERLQRRAAPGDRWACCRVSGRIRFLRFGTDVVVASAIPRGPGTTRDTTRTEEP